jgi:hypothetical protein
MTVAHLERVMGNYEFVKWSVYFGRLAQAAELESKKAGR